ncbi:MAG: hypothetical protein ACI4WM_01415 [Erysipelotrichaceae bacterium]
MKKLLLIMLCLIIITGCNNKETVVQNKEVNINDTWILDETKNDLSIFDDMDKYPGFSEWGAGMSIDDKDISLFIGALSYSGTYTRQDDFIHGEFKGEIDNSLNQWDFYILDENAIEMRLSDMNLYWIRGEINAE